jgi:hypothetical protein
MLEGQQGIGWRDSAILGDLPVRQTRLCCSPKSMQPQEEQEEEDERKSSCGANG